MYRHLTCPDKFRHVTDKRIGPISNPVCDTERKSELVKMLWLTPFLYALTSKSGVKDSATRTAEVHVELHIYPGVPHQCAALFSLGLLHYIHDKTNIAGRWRN